MFSRIRNLPKISEWPQEIVSKRLNRTLFIYLILTDSQSSFVTESKLFKGHWNFMLIENMAHMVNRNRRALCLPNVTKCRNAVSSLKFFLIIHIILVGTTLAILNNLKMLQSLSF